MEIKCWFLQSESMNIPEFVWKLPSDSEESHKDKAQARGFILLFKDERMLKDFHLYDEKDDLYLGYGIVGENEFVWVYETTVDDCCDEVLWGNLIDLEIPAETLYHHLETTEWIDMANRKIKESFQNYKSFPKLPEDFNREKLEEYMTDKICSSFAIPKEMLKE